MTGQLFQLWLHPVHGSSEPQALVLDKRAMAQSIEDRFSLLAEAAAVPELDVSVFPKDSTLVELTINGTLLQTCNLCDAQCTIPITFSQLGFHVSTYVSANDSHTSSNPAGVIALGLPVMSADQYDVDNDQSRPGDVWMLIVTCRPECAASLGIKGSHANDFAMRQAAATLVRIGAICDSFCCVRFSDVAWINDSLGEGSSADVKLMQNPSSFQGEGQLKESVYAVKMWNASYADQDFKVFNEIRHLIHVQGHPNVAEFVGFFRSDVLSGSPRWLMVMEAYISGDLQAIISERGAFPVLDAVTIATGIVSALAHVHTLGVIHRDVKLENILLKEDGDPVLVDFGLAVHMSEREERMRVCGTPGSIAPETLLGMGCVNRSDVFGCGTVLYAMLGGVLPFVRNDHDSTMRANTKAHVKFPENRFRHVSEDVQQLVRKMLRRLPPQRLSSAGTLRMLAKEKERLHVSSCRLEHEIRLEPVVSTLDTVASNSVVAASVSTAENEAIVPGLVHEDENGCVNSPTWNDDTAITAKIDPSISCAQEELEEDVEDKSVSVERKLPSRLPSFSSPRFAWVRRKCDPRQWMRDPQRHDVRAYDENVTADKQESLSKVNKEVDASQQPGGVRRRGLWQSLHVVSTTCKLFRAKSSSQSFSSLVCTGASSSHGRSPE